MWKKAVLIMGLFMSMLTQANAQSIGIGPQLGYQKSRDADKGNFTVGAVLRLKLVQAVGVEASIGYRQEKYADDALTVRSWPVMVTGLLYPIPVVYGAIGAGWYNTTFDYDQSRIPFQAFEDETKQKFGWHFGGGLELPVGSKLKFMADIRYVFLDYKFEQVPGSGELNSNFYIITAGFLFGL